MRDPDPEPELIESALNRPIEGRGRRWEVNIFRLATERGRSFEVVNDHNTSIVRDNLFSTDRDADAAFKRRRRGRDSKPFSTKASTTACFTRQ